MKEHEISKDYLRKVAGLAKINLSDDEVAKFTGDINAIIIYAEKLKGINVDGVEAMVSPLVGNTPLREDIAKPGLTQEEALRAASEKEHGHFRVPKTIQGN